MWQRAIRENALPDFDKWCAEQRQEALELLASADTMEKVIAQQQYIRAIERLRADVMREQEERSGEASYKRAAAGRR